MIREIRSLYLRDELKYDRWGAQGKLLATMEVLRKEGVVMEREKILRLVNMAFPRTFSCQRKPSEGEVLPDRRSLEACLEGVRALFEYHRLPTERIRDLALEETAERFCLDPAFLSRYLE